MFVVKYGIKLELHSGVKSNVSGYKVLGCIVDYYILIGNLLSVKFRIALMAVSIATKQVPKNGRS